MARKITLLTICLLIFGCAAPWNTNFPKIHAGLSRSEVDALLGKARSAEGRDGVEILFYRLASSPLDSDGSDTREYFVVFHDGKVVSYGERVDDATVMRSVQQYKAAWGLVGAVQEAGRQMNAAQQTPIKIVAQTPLPLATVPTFVDGWKDGYAEGWKAVRGKMSIPPIPPIAPIPPINQDTPKDGYNLGFIAGMNAAK